MELDYAIQYKNLILFPNRVTSTMVQKSQIYTLFPAC